MKNPVAKNMIMGETGFKPTSKIHKPGRKVVEDYTNDTYLTGMPQHLEMYGFCKTLLVRREIIMLI